MKKYYSFRIVQRNKRYYFNMLPICTYCGRHADQTTPVGVSEQLGLVRSSVSINVPYCGEHLALIRKFTWIQRGIYFLSYILALTLLYLWGIRFGAPLFVGGTILWGIIFYPFFKYLVIKPMFRILDKERVYDPETNTLGFTARMEMANLVLSFCDIGIAQKFAMANWKNPLIKPLEGSVMSAIMREVTQATSQQ